MMITQSCVHNDKHRKRNGRVNRFGLVFITVVIVAAGIVVRLRRHLELTVRSDNPAANPGEPSDIEGDTEFQMINETTHRVKGNDTCTIVGCYTQNLTGWKHFQNFYSKSGYEFVTTTFEQVTKDGKKVVPTWCRIPIAQREIHRNPKTRVIYVDVDTRLMDVHRWCNMPHLGVYAPIIMTSLFRHQSVHTPYFTITGTRVQANAFVVTPGSTGLQALLRWQRAFAVIPLHDQGVIHAQEEGLCGVPGWIHCYSNPKQQSCHCTGGPNRVAKEQCIKELFNGTRRHCIPS